MSTPVAPSIAALTIAMCASPAFAQTDLFSPSTVHGRLDLRLVAADAESTWLDGGFGKTRFGDGSSIAPEIANAALVWQPRLSWDLAGYVHAQANPGQYNGVDVVEAFLKWKPLSNSKVRYSARAGLFFPPVSLEHDGFAWTPTRTITPSAINSWIGEEVLVTGFEGAAETDIFDHEFKLTGALFGNNDTSGTLLTYRGWALHDVLATGFGDYDIPARSAEWRAFYSGQAPTTEPTREVDGRAGSYVQLDWRPPAPVTFNVMYYDNHGNPEVAEEGQYGWRTRYFNLGARVRLGEDTELLSQYMTGETVMGHQMPIEWMADVGFTSTYVLVSHLLGGDNMLTGRLDWFEVADRTFEFIDDNNEDGWSATIAYQRPISEHASLALEALHISSKKPARIDQAVAPDQHDTQLQASIRLEF